MNLRLYVVALLALTVGCAQATVAPTSTKGEAASTVSEKMALMGIKKAEGKLDCCTPPSRFALIAAVQKTALTKAEQAPAAQPERVTGNSVVEEFLKPAASPTPWLLQKQTQKKLPTPVFLEHPESVFPPITVELTQPPLEFGELVLLPRPLAEDAPFTGQTTDQKVPDRQPLQTKPLVKLPRIDLEKPVELPPLAKYQPDRAPLTDVTGDASLQAVLAKTIPVRVTPEPFVRFFLPDPFEFREIRLSPPVDEK